MSMPGPGSAVRARWVAIVAVLSMQGAFAQPDPAKHTVVQQGGVARWASFAASECGMYGRRYPAVNAVCYYPVDIRTPAGVHEIALYDQDGRRHLGHLTVEKIDFPELAIEMPDDTYVVPSAENLARHREERRRVLPLFAREEGPPRFSLPLGPPASSMPKSEDDFGSMRTFNGKRKSQHTGRDFPTPAGATVKAVADGSVLLAEEHFFTGYTVVVDHGGGLMSMNFHMADLAVAAGDEVKRGEALGKVGSTGRSTGPHLHLGFRWIGKRIDPLLLLDDPTRLPTVGDPRAVAERKIERAESKEPPE